MNVNSSQDLDLTQSCIFSLDGKVVSELAPESISDSAAMLLGEVLDGKFKVLSLLGRGGMGIVYHARHLLLNRDVALKTFLSERMDEAAWLRFQREAKAIAKLKNQHIVQIFDFGIWGAQGIPYYAMELLEGESLADSIARLGCLSLSSALPVFLQVVTALNHAKQLNIVHRDIKPANIFLCSTHEGSVPLVKIVDFGVAKLVTEDTVDGQSLTRTGLIFGSPLYMSPEQAMGGDVDFRSDIYSLGCTFYEALCGRPPFRGKNALATMHLHQSAPRPHLPEYLTGGAGGLELERIVLRSLAVEPSKRYQSFEELRSDLQSASQLAASSSVSLFSPLAESRPTEPDQSIVDQSVSGEHLTGGESTLLKVLVALVLLVGLGAGFYWFDGIGKPAAGGTDSKLKPSEEYFSSINEDGSRTFRLPPNLDINLSARTENAELKPHNGILYAPPGAHLYLKAGRTFFDHPELFRRFRADDLYRLKFDKVFDTSWDGHHLKEILHLSELRSLDIPYTRLTEEEFLTINSFPELLELDVYAGSVDGSCLAKLDRLTELTNLNADLTVNISPALQRLADAKHHKLTNLSLHSCTLSEEDLRNVARIDSLRILFISLDNVSYAGIQALGKNRDLEKLGIECQRIDFNKLPGWPHMYELKVPVGPDQIEDVDRLRRRMAPDCKIGS